MELFGVVLSIPVAFAVCAIYCYGIAKLPKSGQLNRGLRYAGYSVLLGFLIEIVLLGALGAVRSRGILGPGFYVAHLVIFFLGPPALANALVLHPKGFLTRWYVATVLCTIFAFSLVLLQYGVSEALFGID